jgi:NADH-quinone oxidoreductase subunit N
MIGNYVPHGVEYIRILPEIVLCLFGILIMVLEAITTQSQKRMLGLLTLVGIVVAFAANLYAYTVPGQAFQNVITIDAFATFFRGLVLIVGLLCVLASVGYLHRQGAESGEYYSLILFSLIGQCILSTANELIMIFIGLEISSIATYILAGYFRDDRRNNEAALKYFLLGSFATAFLLYGVAWCYGLTGSTNLDEIHRVISDPGLRPPVVLIGIAAALILIGLLFKVSAAPFQIWAPDVYQGAASPVSAFMSAGPKAAAFAVLLRIFMTGFGSLSPRWTPLLWSIALLTMIIGNFAALTQSNVKRLMAYSSIAHAGYILVAVTADSQLGIAAVMFYVAAYALMNIGAFVVIGHVAAKDERYVRIEDLAGLAKRQPATAALFALFVFSLIGVPLTGGFFAKFYVFRAALEAHLVWLTVLGLATSAVAAFYYLKIIVAMYMKEPGESMTNLEPFSPGTRAAVWGAALGTLILGVFPSSLLQFVSYSASMFVQR